ncbi:MAG TPA: hypothetical protein PKC30_16195 [Saprospiraceae bacterium]|nr:hypothetical protein [Saprospiraceae bacterium]
MKNVLFLSCLFLASNLVGQSIHKEETYHVIAVSGLKLRAHPDQNAETLVIIPYGEKVRLNYHESNSIHAYITSRGHFEGHWVPVLYMGLSGYVYDGFLTSLPIPATENQSTQSLVYLFDALECWVVGMQADVNYDTLQQERFTKLHSTLKNGIILEKKHAEFYHSISVHFPGYRIEEIYNVLFAMLSGKDQKKEWLKNAIFLKDQNQQINSVKVGGKNPISIRQNGLFVTVEIMVYEGFCAWTEQ